MKETVELRIYKKYASLLLNPDEGKDLGLYVSIDIPTNDPRFEKARSLTEEVREKHNDFFFMYSEIKRKYSKKEINTAELLHMKIKGTFEPAGEECGTLFDETSVCEICGANRKQISPLTLKKGTIPKKDIARTIAGEIVVSEKFATAYKQRGLKGAKLEPVVFTKGDSNYYQLVAENEIDLSQNTVAGINPFDLSTSNKGEIYKCPEGHTIGLNLISEPYVLGSPDIQNNDVLASKQMIGVNRGLLKPEPLYFCSQDFKRMVDEEKLKGIEFELTHIE
jgi:hypothetical protein